MIKVMVELKQLIFTNKGGEIKLAEAEEKYTVAGHSVTLNKGKRNRWN
jgi:hypothetical protein